MSRTFKDTPAGSKLRAFRYWKWGNMWKSHGWQRKSRESADRIRVRQDLHAGNEPEPTRHRNSVKWDAY